MAIRSIRLLSFALFLREDSQETSETFFLKQKKLFQKKCFACLAGIFENPFFLKTWGPGSFLLVRVTRSLSWFYHDFATKKAQIEAFSGILFGFAGFLEWSRFLFLSKRSQFVGHTL